MPANREAPSAPTPEAQNLPVSYNSSIDGGQCNVKPSVGGGVRGIEPGILKEDTGGDTPDCAGDAARDHSEPQRIGHDVPSGRQAGELAGEEALTQARLVAARAARREPTAEEVAAYQAQDLLQEPESFWAVEGKLTWGLNLVIGDSQKTAEYVRALAGEHISDGRAFRFLVIGGRTSWKDDPRFRRLEKLPDPENGKLNYAILAQLSSFFGDYESEAPIPVVFYADPLFDADSVARVCKYAEQQWEGSPLICTSPCLTAALRRAGGHIIQLGKPDGRQRVPGGYSEWLRQMTLGGADRGKVLAAAQDAGLNLGTLEAQASRLRTAGKLKSRTVTQTVWEWVE